MSSTGDKPKFLLLVTGQIQTAEFPSANNFYFKYSYTYGNEWNQIAGLEEGLSARCQKAHSHHSISVALPIEASFISTNPFGWPQLVLSCYGSDGLGNDIIKGYGATHIPTIPGRTVQRIPMFVPEASTQLQKFIGWITGRRPEFIDAKIVASSEGRLVTRVRSQGTVNLDMQVILKDMRKLGYDYAQGTLPQLPEYPIKLFEEQRRIDITRNEEISRSEPLSSPTSPKQWQKRNLPLPPKNGKNPDEPTTAPSEQGNQP